MRICDRCSNGLSLADTLQCGIVNLTVQLCDIYQVVRFMETGIELEADRESMLARAGSFCVRLAPLLVFCGAGFFTGCVAQLDDLREATRDGVTSEVEETDSSDALPSSGALQTSSSTATSDGASGTSDEGSAHNTCNNGVLNEGELDVDCGGPNCPACADAGSCEGEDCGPRPCEGDCLSFTCSNGFADSNESDEDCGGACLPCATGAGCYAGKDCESGVCRDGICLEPSCDDGIQNGEESDVDCGASDCDACGKGEHCVNSADCWSAVCVAGLCVEARCSDGKTNGTESDVDCGGPDCLPCADGAECNDAADCSSSVCDQTSRSCSVPSCNDKTLNGSETSTDCGGSCEPCGEAEYCNTEADCRSGVCSEGTCRASCNDGQRNQTESDVDCGGECAGCAVGAACEAHADCLSAACDDGECLPGAAGRRCASDLECVSGRCTNEVCEGVEAGAACSADSECITQYCAGSVCGRAAWNVQCVTHNDCASNKCDSGHCAPSGFVIETDGGDDTSIVNFEAQVTANDADPPRQWRDLALLYFFTAETHDDFVSRYYEGPDFDVWDQRFLARSFDGRDWAMIWRAAATNTTVAPSTATRIVYQLRNDPWDSFTLTNDYSFRSGLGRNPKVVVCQRVDGRWVHTQGMLPAAFPDPCALVVDTCVGATGLCDPLLRTQ